MSNHSNRQQHRDQQLIIDLPDLRQSELADITRVLEALTDAFIKHHQHALMRQAQMDRQISLFESSDDEGNAIF